AFKALESDEPKIKTYLYALRAVLCAHWIIRYVRRPPMRFRELLAEFLPDGELREFIDELLQKKESHELKTVERSTVLEGYLKSRLNDLPYRIPKNSGKPSLEEFDRTFLEILEKFERL
ncbi:MAG: hypothetical protein GY859_35475, partial [Desulfobacterales bacterium]|nr:hypothetical protein [Desulfobacterales bacterium]